MSEDTPIYNNIQNPTPIYDNINDNIVKPSRKPQPKVIAATGGTVIGGAVAGIAIWASETIFSIDIPAPVEASIIVVISAILTFAGGYWKRN